MDSYIDLQAIVALNLPNVSKRLPTLRKMAERLGWISRKRQGKGGGLEYLIDSLPPEIQTAIRDKKARDLLAAVPALPEEVQVPSAGGRQRRKLRQLGLPVAEDDFLKLGLSDKQQAVVDARCVLIAYVLTLHFADGLKLGIKEAVRYVCDQIANGTLPEDKMRYVAVANNRSGEKQDGLGFSTLYRWVRLFRSTDDPMERKRLLAPKKTREKMPLEGVAWLPHFLMFYRQPHKPTLKSAARELAAWYAKQGKPLREIPSYDQVCAVMERLPLWVKERGRQTGSDYKALLDYVQRDWKALRPNDVWVGDGHSFKAKVRHPLTGKPFVPEVTVVIDGCSGAVVGWSVDLSETAVAVADALRHGMTHFPPPLAYYSDNGSGETGKVLDDKVTGILPRLGIEHFTGLPGNPQGRGRIERLWRTLTLPLAEKYPTYRGKDMDAGTLRKRANALASAEKAEKRGRALTPAQLAAKRSVPSWQVFLADLEAAVRFYNFEHEHGSLPVNPATGRKYTPMAYYEYRMKKDGMRVLNIVQN